MTEKEMLCVLHDLERKPSTTAILLDVDRGDLVFLLKSPEPSKTFRCYLLRTVESFNIIPDYMLTGCHDSFEYIGEFD